MKGRFLIALLAVIVVGLGVGAGAAALQEKMTGNGGAETAAAQQTRAGGSSNEQSALANPDGGQGGNAGAIENVTPGGFVLVAQSGRVQVATSKDTKVQKMTEAKAADLKVGDSIVATGEQQADGLLAATSVQVGAAQGMRALAGGIMGQFAQSAQRGQNQGSGQRSGQQGAPADRTQGMQAQRGSVAMGSIEAIGGDIITIKAQSGSSLKVKVSATTTITKMADGSLQDLKAGQTAVVSGERESGGTLKAASVQLIPAGQMAGGR